MVQSLKWIFHKLYVTELRLSLLLAMAMANSTSTLFLWEDAISGNDASAYVLTTACFPYAVVGVNCDFSEVFLEQLRNLQPMVKSARRRLNEHQRKQEMALEPEVHELSNEMLNTTKKSQRQIAQIAKPQASSEATTDQASGNVLRRKRRHEGLAVKPIEDPKPRLPPAGFTGPAAKGATDMPGWSMYSASAVKSVSPRC
jgi:hypothetical protein